MEPFAAMAWEKGPTGGGSFVEVMAVFVMALLRSGESNRAWVDSGVESRIGRFTAWIESAFAGVETVPITVAPRAAAHRHRMSPMPPAAACTRTVSSVLTG